MVFLYGIFLLSLCKHFLPTLPILCNCGKIRITLLPSNTYIVATNTLSGKTHPLPTKRYIMASHRSLSHRTFVNREWMRPFSGKRDDCFQIDDHLNTPVFMRKCSSETEFIRGYGPLWIGHCAKVTFRTLSLLSLSIIFIFMVFVYLLTFTWHTILAGECVTQLRNSDLEQQHLNSYRE